VTRYMRMIVATGLALLGTLLPGIVLGREYHVSAVRTSGTAQFSECTNMLLISRCTPYPEAQVPIIIRKGESIRVNIAGRIVDFPVYTLTTEEGRDRCWAQNGPAGSHSTDTIYIQPCLLR
jgi:hypothetical protein